jgi:hypothetical protein
MPLIVILIILLVLFRGGGYYMDPGIGYYGGEGVSLLLRKRHLPTVRTMTWADLEVGSYS